jgi:outer membrane protein assembly factor BamA
MAPAPGSDFCVRIPAVTRFLPVFLLACTLLPAQTHKLPKLSSPSKLTSIKVTGSTRYSQDRIIAATGLRPGQAVNEEDFKSVSQHLGETGAFSSVAYTFQSDTGGVRLELQVTDSNPFVPVRFENFVWLSDQELLEKLRSQVPLFQGELPITGTLIDDVSVVLQGFAIEKSLRGRVDYLRVGPQDGATEAVEFSVTGEPITVRHVIFSGVGAGEQPLLEAAGRKLSGQEYTRSHLVLQATKNFLPVFLERGYLKATVGPPQPKVAEESSEEILVDVAFTIDPGRQYKLSTIELTGNKKLFPEEKLRQSIHMQPGEPANAVQAEKDAQELKRLYGTRGYMAAKIEPTPEINEADATAKYIFKFEEGNVYKMGDLEVRGLDSKATDRVLNAWRLQAGQTYDSGYIKLFLDSIINQYPADQWKVTVRESPEDQEKIVDVSLRFDAIR